MLIHIPLLPLIQSWSSSVGTLGDDSWIPPYEFLDFLKLMDMEEEKENMEEEEFVSFSSVEIPDDDPSFHTEL